MFKENTNWNRRKFLRSLAVTVGLGFSAETLLACGEVTSTSAIVTNTSDTTNPASTSNISNKPAIATPASKTTTNVDDADSQKVTTGVTSSSGPATPTPINATPAPTDTAGYSNLGPANDFTKLTDAPKPIDLNGKIGYVLYKEQLYIYSNICTHQGCQVLYDSKDKEFECPCHGSKYELTGTVKHGPAKDRLPLFEYKIVNNNLFVRAS